MTQFNPIAEEGIPAQVRRIELELRALQQQLAQALVGGRVNLTHTVGVLPPGSGGTGGTAAPFGVTMMKNTSGGTVEAGSVVIVKTAAQEFTTTTTLGDPLAFGIAVEDIANNAFGPVRVVGYQATVLVTGAVTAGDYLRSSTTVKRAISSGTDFLAGCFAIAQTAAAGPGSGTVSAVIISTERLQAQVTVKGALLAGVGAGDLDQLTTAGATDGWVLTKNASATHGMEWAVVSGGGGSGGVPFPPDLVEQANWIIKETSVENQTIATTATRTIANISAEGIMVEMFIAVSGNGPHRDLVVKMYVDGEVTPSVTFDVGALGTHLGSGNQVFDSKHVAIEQSSANTDTGYTFKFPVPFSTSLQIDLYNPTAVTATVWTDVYWTEDLSDERRLHSAGATYLNKVTVNDGADRTILNFSGDEGVLAWTSFICDNASNQTYLERNIQVTIDSVLEMNVTGTEDWFTGAFYYIGGARSRPWGYAWVPTSTSSVQALDLLELMRGVHFASSINVVWKDEVAVTTNVDLTYLVLYYTGAPPIGSGITHIEDLLTTELDTGKYIRPDGTGLLVWDDLPSSSGAGPIPIPFGSTVALGHGYSSALAGDYQKFGEVDRLINPSQYSFSPLRVALEVILASGAGAPAYARLYNVTTAAAVSGSVIQTSQLIGTRIRSPYLTLASALDDYRVEFAPSAGDEAICYDAVLWVGGDELAAGNNIAPSADDEDDDMPNEIMNFPSLEGADDVRPFWWSNNDANAALTEVDLAGEGITEKYERALKLVITTATSYAKQLFTYADQPRLKSGQTVSIAFDVWAVAGAQAGVRLQSSVGSLGVANSTAAAWTRLAVEAVVLNGTTVEIRLEGAVGTYYFAPLGFRVAATAPTNQQRPRGTRKRWRDSVQLVSQDAAVDPNTWTDIDVTANTSPLACWALCTAVGIVSVASRYGSGYRRKGSAEALAVTNPLFYGLDSASQDITNDFQVVLDENQIFQYILDRISGAVAIPTFRISLHGWEEWE